MYDLSILIPSRNEIFLAKTIENILENIEGNTEIIAVLDGAWSDPPVFQDDRVTIIYHPVSVGQREATNEACKLSEAKYVMKVDAHCAFDKGFDVKMMAKMKDNYTMAPIMRNLWAFDWKCYHCGWKTYQGRTPDKCPDCGKTDKIRRKMMWVAKTNPQSRAYCFDSEPHFQYFREYYKRHEYLEMLEREGITESMSLQGSCFMMTREKYWELKICDSETFGSWGSQGIEVAVKTWLSGGRVVVNHDTYYGHMFRTQGGDFGFPYKLPGSQVRRAKKKAKKIFFESSFEGQILPLSWLLEKFWPVPGWTDEELQQVKDSTPTL